MNWLRRIFLALVAAAIAQIIYYYPQMPEVVASHFDGLGAPNDWSSRNGFFGIYAAILLMLIGIFIFVPGWSEKRASFGMKIPHRDYWLAPERIEKTKLFFRRQMMIMGIVHLALAIYAIQLAILANFDQQPRLHTSIGWALGLYFVFLIGWLIHFYLHFRKP
ncbi:MAG: DUF1648 domain-containing protein [Gammaproteobacteria bacterium]|nr:DUF1648 domain-containing protein [Gammaproteobacteria bacterium]